MKTIKMVCAAAIMLLTAAASLGASSAIAGSTALCTQTPEGGFDFPGGTYLTGEACTEGHWVSHVHDATLEAEKAKLLSSFLTVECDALFLGEVLGLGSPELIHGNFTYSNCGNCEVTETSPDALLKFLRTSHETATVTYEHEVFVDCGGSILECEYDGEGLAGTAKGWWLSAAAYPNGEITISEQKMHKTGGGFFCPQTTKLDIRTMPLTRMFIGT